MTRRRTPTIRAAQGSFLFTAAVASPRPPVLPMRAAWFRRSARRPARFTQTNPDSLEKTSFSHTAHEARHHGKVGSSGHVDRFAVNVVATISGVQASRYIESDEQAAIASPLNNTVPAFDTVESPIKGRSGCPARWQPPVRPMVRRTIVCSIFTSHFLPGAGVADVAPRNGQLSRGSITGSNRPSIAGAASHG